MLDVEALGGLSPHDPRRLAVDARYWERGGAQRGRAAPAPSCQAQCELGERGQAAVPRTLRDGRSAAIAALISAAGMTWVISSITLVAVVAVVVAGKANDAAVSTSAAIPKARRVRERGRQRQTGIEPRITIA